MHVTPRPPLAPVRRIAPAALAAVLAAAPGLSRPALAAPPTCHILVQTTSRNDEMLDRIRAKAVEKLAASGRYVVVTDPRAADATIETNSAPMKGRLGGTAMAAMLLAGQRSRINTQVLLSSFIAVYALGQEDGAADGIVAMIDGIAGAQGAELCPTGP